jgi:hypothetical protein
MSVCDPKAGLSVSIIARLHWRGKTASRAALHPEETEPLAVVRHPRILPLPATTCWQRCTASLSQLRTIWFANAAHPLDSFCLILLDTFEHVVSVHWHTVALVCKFFATSYRDCSSVFFRSVLRLSNTEMDSNRPHIGYIQNSR